MLITTQGTLATGGYALSVMQFKYHFNSSVMMDSLIKKRIIIAIGCTIIIGVSIYGFRITEARHKVLKNGKLEKAIVERISSKRKGSLYVRLNDTVFDAGNYLPQYNCNVGDTIEVYYLDSIKCVVPKSRGSFLGYFILEISTFFIGIITLILLPLLNDEKFKN